MRLDPSENQVLRSAGDDQPDGAREAEAREDARLLAIAADGEPQGLAALYRRRAGLIYALLVRILGNEMEAQEIMQDTFLLIWRRAREYDPGRSAPLAWMIMIARGRALDQLRARSRRKAVHAAYEQEVVSLEVEVNEPAQPEQDELAAACAAALHGLPEEQGHALQLAFFRGWTHEEIARAQGAPLGTVKARIRRGLLALRQVLKDYHA